MELTISLHDSKYHRIEPQRVGFHFDLDFLGKAMQPLDRPSLDAGPMAVAICTSKPEIVATENDRKRIAKIIANKVEDFFLNQFEKSDTTMGYRNVPNVNPDPLGNQTSPSKMGVVQVGSRIWLAFFLCIEFMLFRSFRNYNHLS